MILDMKVTVPAQQVWVEEHHWHGPSLPTGMALLLGTGPTLF